MSSALAAYTDNGERRQDKVRDAFAWFTQRGYVIHPKSRRIYAQLATRLRGVSIIEAGCGIGTGAAMLSLANAVIATDKERQSVAFAREMYPWLRCALWDVAATPYIQQADMVVAVEMLEHIAAYATAMQHMLETATHAVWLSTPNRRSPTMGQDRPKNPYHVHEFLPEELCDLASPYPVTAYHWETWEPVDMDTTEGTPLVYCITKDASTPRW